MKIYLLAIVLLGCRQRNSEMKDQLDVQSQQEHYRIAQPIPKIEFSLERDVVIKLYAARNERVATHTVWRGDTSIIEGDCPSIGYPIPYDTSLTNPVQASGYCTETLCHEGAVTIEQAEPNGLFPSKNSTATWIRCVVDGMEVPIYVEGKVTAYPYPVAVDYQKGLVTRAVGVPSVILHN